MAQAELEIVTPRADQIGALDALLDPALHFPPGGMREWIEAIGPENFRAVRHKDRFVAGLGFAPIGRWFGGACVPIAAIYTGFLSPHECAYLGTIAGPAEDLEVMRQVADEECEGIDPDGW